jgi:ubiquinone/menaquinone biosynthesis C-methylase UbiE
MTGRNPEEDPAAAVHRLQASWDDRVRTAASDGERVDSSRRTQRMRFEAFILNRDLHGRSVLDLGCGVGDFWEHLQRRGIACDYTGLDISPEMIKRCRDRFPGITFETGNVLDWQKPQQFDFVVSFGIHNVKIDGGLEILRRVTERQFELSRVAAHVSLLTDRFTGFGPHAQAWRAADVFAMALEITPYVVARHDYLPHDFSVTLYREPLIDTRRDLLLG